MRSFLLLVVILLLAWSSVSAKTDRWKLVWSDEFSYSGLPDSSKWNFDTGATGWGNAEQQFYTARLKNCRVAHGHLTIEARKEHFGTSGYTSARLVTKGKAAWQYGRIEVRAKLPSGRGTWPAMWLLPLSSPLKLPDDGEIDIMEEVGYDPGVINATIHCTAYNERLSNEKSSKLRVPGCSKGFHVYSVDWSADAVKMSVDGKLYFTYLNDQSGKKTWPFDQPFYLLLNIAVGGVWGGSKGIDDNALPQAMEVDYVRVYQKY